MPNGGVGVSIRSRLLGREKRDTIKATYTSEAVSIRSRLLGREKRDYLPVSGNIYEFQSAPGFWAGRNVGDTVQRGAERWFQSAPGFWAGRNRTTARCRFRSESFNPLPAFGPGETLSCLRS